MINNIRSLQKNLEMNMQKCINILMININKVHISRVSSNMLDSVMVEYYGVLTPVSQLTNSIAEQSRTLAITVFDPKMVKIIEKAILSSDLGLIPILNRNTIRITLPLLTEDRRRKLIKMVRIESEKSRIAIRNIRRIFNEKIKTLLKNKEITKDDEHFLQSEIQNLTNHWIKKVDFILKQKELELIQF